MRLNRGTETVERNDERKRGRGKYQILDEGRKMIDRGQRKRNNRERGRKKKE